MIVLFDYYCRESPAAVINQRNTRTLVKRQSVQSKDLMVGECRPDPACFCLDPGTLQGGATRLRSLTVLPGLRFPASVPLGRRMHLDSTVAGKWHKLPYRIRCYFANVLHQGPSVWACPWSMPMSDL